MSEEPLHVTLVKYDSGLGVPGIMPPEVNSSIEIRATPTGGKVVKQSFKNNRPHSTEEGQITGDNILTVHGLVDELKTLPSGALSSGTDVFGANTVVLVRKGKDVVWAYNPSTGCTGGPDSDQASEQSMLQVNDDHKAKFADIVSRIYKAGDASV
ncbi:hypothetical protein H4R20_001175 [Coemansia guatemalensis]|uniref:Uncharacterized protein n=1 Tax=Coemansia guatemalensis TaxID=2761395 RepID=A0A9W8LV60_9FUNG|nr:hypothetical protein H4R20_001175 [Coemansia guatemalensis]